jgi:nucleotide-binding universal stress UspA family protein
MQPSMASAPVVLGIRPGETVEAGERENADEEVLDFGFARANALRVPVVVVSAFEPPWLQAWSPTDLDRARAEHDADLEKRLARWRNRFPVVEIEPVIVAEAADRALVEASRVAQLTVVGRHHARTLTGRLGSTAVNVLKAATRPVAVVPSGNVGQLTRELVARRTRPDRGWAPTF